MSVKFWFLIQVCLPLKPLFLWLIREIQLISSETMKELYKIVYFWASESSNSGDLGGTQKTGKDWINGIYC